MKNIETTDIPKNNDFVDLGAKIKRIRKESSDKTQVLFAKRLGIAPNYVYMIESGREIPSNKLLKDVCRIYGVSYDWLFNDIGDPYEEQVTVREIVKSFLPDNEFAVDIISSMAGMPLDWWKDLERLAYELKEQSEKNKKTVKKAED